MVEFEKIPYHDGVNICLVGDACHPLSDFTSQGVSSALEDATVLAECVQATGNIKSALEKYESLRRGHINDYFRAGEALVNNFKSDTSDNVKSSRPFTRTGSMPVINDAESNNNNNNNDDGEKSEDEDFFAPHVAAGDELSPSTKEIERKRSLLYTRDTIDNTKEVSWGESELMERNDGPRGAKRRAYNYCR